MGKPGGAARRRLADGQLAGGTTAKPFVPRAVSRQGMVAGFEPVAQSGGGWRLAFGPLDGSAPIRLLAPTLRLALSPRKVLWAPDGTAINLMSPESGLNVARHPIDGGPPGSPDRRFRAAQVQDADVSWSFDGRRLLLSRGENKGDVVLLRRSDGR